MGQVAKVTISLPRDLLEYVEKKRQEGGVSRSEVVQRAIERLRREEWEQQIDEQYVRGWREQPQTDEEFGWLEVSLGSLADLPWEEDENDDATRGDLVGKPAASVGTPSGPARRAG